MFRSKFIKALILIAPLSACAVIGSWLPGQIYSNNGTMMTFAIQSAFHSGGMRAYNPKTGERFTGSYVGISPGASETSFGTMSGGSGVVSGSEIGVVRSNVANATGFLHGTKGTMMTCEMQIQRGLYPHGIGTCTDNHHVKYHLQF